MIRIAPIRSTLSAKTEKEVETVAKRDDRLGAVASVLLALARDEQPAADDLRDAELPFLNESAAADEGSEK